MTTTISTELMQAQADMEKAQLALAAAGKKVTDRLKRERNAELRKQQQRDYAASLARKQHESLLAETDELLGMVDPDLLNQPATVSSSAISDAPVANQTAAQPVIAPAPPAPPVDVTPPATQPTVVAVVPKPADKEGTEELSLGKTVVVTKKQRTRFIVATRSYFDNWKLLSWFLAIVVLVLVELVMLSTYDGFYPGKPDVVRFLFAFIFIPFILFMIGGHIGILVNDRKAKTKVITKTVEQTKPAE